MRNMDTSTLLRLATERYTSNIINLAKAIRNWFCHFSLYYWSWSVSRLQPGNRPKPSKWGVNSLLMTLSKLTDLDASFEKENFLQICHHFEFDVNTHIYIDTYMPAYCIIVREYGFWPFPCSAVNICLSLWQNARRLMTLCTARTGTRRVGILLIPDICIWHNEYLTTCLSCLHT